MSPTQFEEFVERFKRVSESINFWHCGSSKDVEACIKKRIRNALEYRKGQLREADSEEDKKALKMKIKQLNNLLKSKFAYQVSFNHWLNIHPIFREKLGSLDDLKEPREILKKSKKLNTKL